MSEPNDNKIEQPKVGELPPRPKLVAYPAHGSGLIAFFDVDDTERYISEVSSQLLAERQVSAGLREIVATGSFYKAYKAMEDRAEAAETSLAEAIAQRDEERRWNQMAIEDLSKAHDQLSAAEAQNKIKTLESQLNLKKGTD